MRKPALIAVGLLAALLLALAPVSAQDGGFVDWDWARLSRHLLWSEPSDPLALEVPPVYAGNLPALPVDLSAVLYTDVPGLTQAELALLAQNGFVVVPAGLDYFDQAYNWDDVWQMGQGHGWFVTTDSFLHTLHFIFDNLLADLEKAMLYPQVSAAVDGALTAAQAQLEAAAGTPLETAAQRAVTYLSIAQQLLSGEADASRADEYAVIQQALAADTQADIPFLGGYVEDFSAYRPRGHYAGDALLERYFRGMTWLSRITFLANNQTATQSALLMLRALRGAPDAFDQWQDANDLITFLIGQADDLGPNEYGPLADAVFGAGLPLEALADAGKLADFMGRVRALPGPRINGLFLPAETPAGDISEISRGFRLMGQRFTVDANVLQQLMDPYVPGRMLPSALDVAAAVGSDVALSLALEAGADEFPAYAGQMAQMRAEVGALSREDWLQNVYGAWLWTLEPLWTRSAAAYPPLMQTEAWLLKDLHTGLGSYTQLKHDTVLYTKPPGGLGGGGMLVVYSYVEPNPLVFARIAVVAMMAYEGLNARGLDNLDVMFPQETETGAFADSPSYNLMQSASQLPLLAQFSAQIADLALKELKGEPFTEDEYMLLQGIGTLLSGIRYVLQDPNNREPVALVTDIANSPMTGEVLQEAVGGVDYLYVVVPHPDGFQIVRGGVFSYYEFAGDINRRLTDEEWRAMVAAGSLPPRPAWTAAFIGQ